MTDEIGDLTAVDEKAVWSTAKVNDFPDSSFLYVKPNCGKKDSDGKTKPRSCRMFPYKDASGKVDLPHLRNAIARIPQSKLPSDIKKRLQARARRILTAQKDIDADELKELIAMTDEKSSYYDADGNWKYVPYGVISFAQYDAFLNAQELARESVNTAKALVAIVENIMNDPDVDDKAAALKKVASEYGKRTRRKSVIDRIKETFRRDEEPQRSEMTIWKEADGTYRFLGIHTNNYRDDDIPPEILAADAHRKFVSRVESGELPYPQLWHFHLKATHWGNVDFLHYDEDTGFMLSSGYILRGHEAEAEAIMAMDEPVAMSHGMPTKSIRRDPEDSTVIVEYQSIEISDLPHTYAANKGTAFAVIQKESEMSLPQFKREFLRKVGLSDERISEIESELEDRKEAAVEAGLESKEQDEQKDSAQENPDEQNAQTDDKQQYATVSEVTDALMPLIDAVAALTKEVSELRASQQQQLKEITQQTPKQSLADLLNERIASSAVGSPETRVDGRSSLAKMKPDEAPDAEQVERAVGIPLIDNIIALNHRT